MARYDHQSIERKWQERWAREQPWAAREDSDKPKFYALIEFPYPSGEGLHVGHLRPYIGMDVIARKRRMEGKEVLYPIGWDAFGLPAENYALKTGQHPRITTAQNAATYKRQIQSLGISFDWSREVNTTDPAYYRWTQWIFLQLLKHGLAYKARMPINWCPSCKIGLANEEAVGGACDRCGGLVEKRDREQWMLKITAYAEKLLAGLETVDYIERAKVQQVNWIGKSAGATIAFPIRFSPSGEGEREGVGIPLATRNSQLATSVEVFTTRPDTLFGATYLVLAPEHPLVERLLEVPTPPRPPSHGEVGKAKVSPPPEGRGSEREWGMLENSGEVRAYLDQARRKADIERAAEDKDKTGIELKGVRAVNPANGEEIPVWVADYVLGSYGTGAIMAVPAHDERDFVFAKRYDLSIREVVAGGDVTSAAYTGDGVLMNSGKFTGMRSEDAKRAITESVGGKTTVTYKLRDWVFSRQRYWGEPIPVVFCGTCGTVPVPEDQLPVLLPDVERYQPTDTGDSPLAAITDWVNTECPRCGGPAKRETDVMPNWAGSSWYFLAYAMHASLFPKSGVRGQWSDVLLKHWMPVDWYNGGMEHTTLHLLYSRFWNLFLHDIGVVPVAEPYRRRTSHGLILAHDGEKMSKSRGNVVNPDAIVEEYGADAVRLYEMFIGPFDQAVPWSTDGLIGCRRFLERVYAFLERVDTKQQGIGDAELIRLLHKTIKKVTDDIEAMRFNTAVSALMECANALGKRDAIPVDVFGTFLRLLAPFAPHTCEELWEHLRRSGVHGQVSGVLEEPWPTYDPVLIVEAELDLVVQVNGKVRATIRVPADITEDAARDRAFAEPNVQKHLGGKEPRKVIVVPGKLVSIVT